MLWLGERVVIGWRRLRLGGWRKGECDCMEGVAIGWRRLR